MVIVENNGTELQSVNVEKVKTRKSTKKKSGKIDFEKLKPISIFQLYYFANGKDKLLMTIGLVSAVITGFAMPATLYAFGRLIDVMVKQGRINAIFTPHANTTRIISKDKNVEYTATIQILFDFLLFQVEIFSFEIWIIIIGIVTLAFSYLSIVTFNFTAHNQIFRLRSAFIKSLLNRDMAWYDLNKIDEIASRIDEDLAKLEEGIGEKAVIWIMYQVTFLASIMLASVQGILLALIYLISLPISMSTIGIVGVIASKLSKREKKTFMRADKIAEELLDANETAVAFDGKSLESPKYTKLLVKAKNISILKGFFMGLGFGFLLFFIYASYAIAFWYGLTLVLEQRNWPPKNIIYTPGIMFSVFFSVMMGGMGLGLSTPLIEVFSIAKRAGAKVHKIIKTQPPIVPVFTKQARPNRFIGSISFRNVTFHYPNKKGVNVLQNLELSIKAGETVALVGSPGCGKSTLLQLIQRFYDPDHGEIFLHDINIKSLDVNWLRSRMAIVGPEPIIFGTTIYENIQFGNESATRKQIEGAAKIANVHNFIRQLPDGYQTVIGEIGVNICRGQKQRICIARALVRHPKILLFDEVTSTLNAANMAKVQTALDRVIEGRTTIFVPHKLSTIRETDRIIVLKNGKVVETGYHWDLMNLQGEYFNLVTAQMGTEVSDTDLECEEDYDEDQQVAELVTKTWEHDQKKCLKNLSIWKILKWNKTEWMYIVVGSLSPLVIGVTIPLFAISFGEALGVLSHGDNNLVRSEINLYSHFFLISGVVVGFMTFLQIYTYTYAGGCLMYRLKSMLLVPNSEMTTMDTIALQEARRQRIGTILQAVSTILTVISISMFCEWRLGIFGLAITPLTLTAIYMEMTIMEEEKIGNSKMFERSSEIAAEFIANIRTVMSFGMEKIVHKIYIDTLTKAIKSSRKKIHRRGFVYGLCHSSLFFAIAALTFIGKKFIARYGVNYGNVFVVILALIMGTVSITCAFLQWRNFTFLAHRQANKINLSKNTQGP